MLVPSVKFRVTSWSLQCASYISTLYTYLLFTLWGTEIIWSYFLSRPVFAFLHCYISQRPMHTLLVLHPDRLINHSDNRIGCKRILQKIDVSQELARHQANAQRTEELQTAHALLVLVFAVSVNNLILLCSGILHFPPLIWRFLWELFNTYLLYVSYICGQCQMTTVSRLNS